VSSDPHGRAIDRSPAALEERRMFQLAKIAADYVSNDSLNNQGGPESHLHVMNGDLQLPNGDRIVLTPEQSQSLANRWMRDLFTTAQDYRAAGDIERFNFFTGVAIHAMQDATSPQHRDALTGQLKRWTGEESFGRQLAHGLGETHDPGAVSHLQLATDMTYWWFKNNDLPAGDLVGMFGVDAKGKLFQPTGAMVEEWRYQWRVDRGWPDMRYEQPIRLDAL
jgi:hypothetical protein